MKDKNQMKQITTTVVLLFLSNITFAQDINNKSLEQRTNTTEDKMAIKNVVDVFSNLADTKEIDKQVLLFTEDGEVESITNGQSYLLKGREQLKQAFSGFLSNFQTVYHQNGQQIIELNGNTAETTSYCTVTLIGMEDGKQMKITLYAIYNDSFIKEDGKWLIAHRKSNFVLQEKMPLTQ